MIVKTLSGVVFLDEPYGGVFAGRNFLVCGRSGTGKTAVGLHFLQQGLLQEERCLLLSTMPANDVAILAESYGFDLAADIERGNLVLLEYESFVPGHQPQWGPMPAEGFSQLHELVQSNMITRIVLDTVLPWVSVPSADMLTEHVFSFVRSFDRMNVTTLMTLPKPVSSMAFRLKKTLEDITPICVLLSPAEEDHVYRWQTVKYLGLKKTEGPVLYQLTPTSGITAVDETAEDAKAEAPTPAETPAPAVAASPAVVVTSRKVRFASKIPTAPTRLGEAAARETAAPPPAKPAGPARLSSVWKPSLNQPAQPPK